MSRSAIKGKDKIENVFSSSPCLCFTLKEAPLRVAFVRGPQRSSSLSYGCLPGQYEPQCLWIKETSPVQNQTNKRALIVLRGPRIQNSRNEWVFEWLLLWQACCDRITHSVEQIGPWVLAGPRGLSTAPRLRLSQRWAAHSMAIAWQALTVSLMVPMWMQEYS